MKGPQLALLFVPLIFTCFARDGLVVQTENGPIQGQFSSWIFQDEGREWLGIRYAAPPLGALRFRPPLPFNETWNSTRKTIEFGAACPQTTDAWSSFQSEDCLTVNVFAPVVEDEGSGHGPLPVMVFLYGGSWEEGASSNALYSGHHIIADRKNVILVTLNYRLGALGYLASGSLANENADGSTGNMGLLDQRLALRWVQKNIAAFGGDPQRVLLFGESAGAGSTSNHLIMERSWGLFARALMESGPFAHWTARPLEVAEEQFSTLVKALNCTDDDPQRTLHCLRQASVKDILKVHTNVQAYFTEWSPVIDGVEIVANPQELAKAGKVAHVPVLLGTNRNEGTLFARNVSKTMNNTAYQAYLKDRYGPFAEKLYQLYPPRNYASAWQAATAIIGDGDMTCAARRTARWLRAAGNDVYLYFFTHVWDEVKLVDPSLGVFHGSELPYVFKLPDGLYEGYVPFITSPEEQRLQGWFVDYWTQFASTGNPSSADGVTWPLYDEVTDKDMDLDLKLDVRQYLKKDLCDWWDTVYMKLN